MSKIEILQDPAFQQPEMKAALEAEIGHALDVLGETTVTVFSEGEGEWSLPEFMGALQLALAEIPEEHAGSTCFAIWFRDRDEARFTVEYKRPETEAELLEKVERALDVITGGDDEDERAEYERLKRKYE